jgi:predicted nucleotidyltransferase
MRLSHKPGPIDITEAQIREMAQYCDGEADILALYMYGSFGTQYQTPLSDVDLAVLPATGRQWDLHRELAVSDELARIAGTEDVNTVNLRSVPVTLQMRILDTGKSLFVRDPGALADFAAGVILRHADFEPDLAAFYRDWDCNIREEFR